MGLSGILPGERTLVELGGLRKSGFGDANISQDKGIGASNAAGITGVTRSGSGFETGLQFVGRGRCPMRRSRLRSSQDGRSKEKYEGANRAAKIGAEGT